MSTKKESNGVLIGFFIVIALIVGFSIGTTVEVSEQAMEMNGDDHEHDAEVLHAHDETHMHEMIPVTSKDIPTLSLELLNDTKSGYNLNLITTNFEFTPEQTGLDVIENTGHAHLYINGEKITRLYSEWYHIPELISGIHEIRVTLNANSHEEWTVFNQTIEDTIVVNIE